MNKKHNHTLWIMDYKCLHAAGLNDKLFNENKLPISFEIYLNQIYTPILESAQRLHFLPHITHKFPILTRPNMIRLRIQF